MEFPDFLTPFDANTFRAQYYGKRPVHISRGSDYYLPRPVPEADLAIMPRLDRLHLEYPFAG